MILSRLINILIVLISVNNIQNLKLNENENNELIDDDGFLAHDKLPVFKLKTGLKFSKYKYKNIVKSDSSTTDKRVNRQSPKNKYENTNSNIPNTVYPEILIVVDNKLHKKLGDASKNTVSYILNYWNSVDIRYRSLTSPKYRLNIAGIVIEYDENQLTYLSDNIWKPKAGVKMIDVNNVLKESGKFWYKFDNTIPFSSYDVLITMTLRELCKTVEADHCSHIIDGQASMEAACKIDHDQRELCRVGIISDKGNYQSINTAAHELGHLLGADHDDDNGVYKRCLPNHIMRSIDEDNRVNTTVYWTDCSKKGFKKFITDEKSKCLFNVPKKSGKILSIELPGNVVNKHEQCINFKPKKYEKSCSHSEDLNFCSSLFCETYKGKCREIKEPPLDGTSCGNNNYCLLTECIEKQ